MPLLILLNNITFKFNYLLFLFKSLSVIGAQGIHAITEHGRWGCFTLRLFVSVFRPPFKFSSVIKEIKVIGVESLSIIVFTALFTGMVLGLQGYTTLKQFGSEGLLGIGVTASLFSELGPVLTALLLIGRAGSSLCAQIGVMRNSEQIDALECMGIDPFNFLISPKLLAAIIVFPILSFLFCIVGTGGGYFAGVYLLGVNPGAYYDGMVRALYNPTHVNMCLYKSLCFSVLMISICACKGYYVHMHKVKGALAVARCTTEAVVFSSVSILIWDYLITSILI